VEDTADGGGGGGGCDGRCDFVEFIWTPKMKPKSPPILYICIYIIICIGWDADFCFFISGR